MTKRLLVIDDAMIIREMIKDAAREDGWEIVGHATNGQEGIEQFEKLQPDAVTLDLVMPEFDGMHGLRGIKQLNRDAQVLIVSALDQAEILKEALRAGAADFIAKPFNKGRLLAALQKIAARTAKREPQLV
ncbi:response regulator [Anatilimnocola floriformis]|uniref:response regulator n=1 Tax=Anatilimnocola floriformis TaxID=2948575 RepID=UPI0020C39D62|nr:response regulator [Anatilimnocola floriformis]